MKALEELHNNIMFYLAVAIVALTLISIFILLNYFKSLQKRK